MELARRGFAPRRDAESQNLHRTSTNPEGRESPWRVIFIDPHELRMHIFRRLSSFGWIKWNIHLCFLLCSHAWQTTLTFFPAPCCITKSYMSFASYLDLY
jgi:hypothetical protein